MLFHSFAFFVFFCVTFTVYWRLKKHRWRMVWLLFASFVFSRLLANEVLAPQLHSKWYARGGQ